MRRAIVCPWLVAASVALLGLVPRRAMAQDAVISGKVTGAQGEVLGGAIVNLRELNVTVSTNATGTYAVTIAADHVRGQQVTAHVRYIGYKPGVATLTLSPGRLQQDFRLELDPFRLSEVVVTGTAGPTEKAKLTFSAPTIDADQLREAPGVNALSGLSGKAAGVRTIQPSGEPGSATKIRLRGATSLTGTQDPLVIVDGTITRATLADMNSEDIERIEVVKGAAASSLYGSDAANGVVQIFTKRGDNLADGRLQVTVRNEAGMSLRPKSIPVSVEHPYALDSLDPTGCTFARDVNGNRYYDADTGGGRPALSSTGTAVGISDHPYCNAHDHQSEVLTRGPFITNYMSMGQRKGNTNLNVSYQSTHQDGVILLLKGYNRQNFRINFDQALTPRFDLSVGAFFARSDNNTTPQGPGSPFFAVTFVEPNIDLFAKNPDGSPYRAAIPDRVANPSNPLYFMANTEITTDRTRYTGFVRGRWRLNDWLSAEGNYNYDQEDSARTEFQPKGFLDANGGLTDGYLLKADGRGRSFNWGATLTSVRTLGAIRNTSKAAIVVEDQRATQFRLTANTINVVGIPEFPATDFANVDPLSSDQRIRNRNAYFVSTFDIHDRYIVDGLFRRDGSSLFGEESRHQNYYRVSGAWRVSEDFNIPNVDELRLRASYGTAGLRPQFNAQYETYTLEGGTPVKQNLGNPFLKPARSGELEVGANADFLGRFSLEYSYSRKLTRDQILLVPLSAATGYRNQWRNAGTLRGISHELTFQALLANRPGFHWTLNIAGDRTRQRIMSLTNKLEPIGPGYAGTGMFEVKVGEDVGAIYGNRTVRTLAELYDDPAKVALSGTGQTWAPESVVVNEEGFVVQRSLWRTGEEKPILYVDPSGSSIVKIGDANPDFNLSFTSTLRLGKLSIYGLVDWVQGGDIYNGTRQWPFFENRDRVYDQGSKPVNQRKPLTYYNVFYNSINPIDFFVENGTWVKIKEVNVSYTFDRATLQRLGVHWFDNVRLGVIGRNLFTFTSYSGYDPEVADLSGDAFSFRFDGFSYPNFRTFTGVVELGF
jgi:TonB-linked SusC/RagA family outer membrane protein